MPKKQKLFKTKRESKNFFEVYNEKQL